ncbi:hypothetical protein PGT21_003493 [Puccinia graminis f. sp. tritici]|uniref:Uncharacterized protein n=1 Tax=Puccinia graminis f. sp. tritici TaxID=56615 RepID=A0A5B0PPX3_PUCGR|nr:hypothetical protein PGT21_003493 [Puccinia graminis f. sp. tritici]
MASFHDEWEQEQRAEEFEWERCQPDQMLVCSLEELEGVFRGSHQDDRTSPSQIRPLPSQPTSCSFVLVSPLIWHRELLEEVLTGLGRRIMAKLDLLAIQLDLPGEMKIYVFIIRDAERRLDKLIDSTILDFEPLPEMAVDFEPEGSWRFVRALTVKRNRTTSFRPAIPFD